MFFQITLLTHIAAGAIAIASGLLALTSRKGGRLHVRAGQSFVISMSYMAATGIGMAVSDVHWFFMIVGTLAFYLVATGRRAVRRAGSIGPPDYIALGVSAMCSGVSFVLGIVSLATHKAVSGIPAAIYLGIGVESLIFAWIDYRSLRAGGFRGSHRLADHVWRMIAALAFAMTALLVANNGFLPPALRSPAFTYTPVAALYVAMTWWLVRLLRKNGAQPGLPVAESDDMASVPS